MSLTICIFCGARDGNNSLYTQEAKKLGAILAEKNIKLVYGGASIGVMGAVAEGCLDAGGEVIGIIPESLMKLEVGSDQLTELHVVKDMHARKQKMHEISDGFICLPGGIGTLDEFFETATWKQLDFHKKPIGFLNTNQYYSKLFSALKFMANEGFIYANDIESLLIDESANNLINKMRKSL